jgi:hypothetical protein
MRPARGTDRRLVNPAISPASGSLTASMGDDVDAVGVGNAEVNP